MDGQLVRVDGNPLHPVSRGGLCPKGRAGIQLFYHPGRLTGPMERVGPPGSTEFRRISWEAALDRVGRSLAGLREQGQASSAVWIHGDVTDVRGEMLRRFARVYGTPHLLAEDYDDGASRVLGLTQGLGSAPAFDLEASDFVLCFGAGTAEAWWCLPQAARARGSAAGRRPRWIQVDVRHSRTAATADQWVPVRPGTYGTLALGIAYVVLKEGLYDADMLRDQVHGLEDWTGPAGETVPGFRTLVLRHGRTEEVSRRTGVPPETLVGLAKSFGSAERAVALWDHAVAWRTGGLGDAMAIHALNILAGAPNRRGGVLVQPPLPVPRLDGASDPGVPDRAAGTAASLTSADWASRIASGQVPPVQALFLYQANPVASSPRAEEAARALDRVPLVVSFSPFLDESARHSHLVLPDHTYLERWQDATAPASVPIAVWGVVQPMVPALQDTRATSEVLMQIAGRLGGEVAAGFPWTSMEQVVEARGRALASANRGGALDNDFRRGELREMESRGWWIPHGLPEDEFWALLRGNGGWFDPYYDYDDRSVISSFPDGRVRLFSLEARAAIAASGTALAEGFLPIEAGETAAVAAEEEDGRLRLLPYRVLTLASGGTVLMPWLLEDLGVLTGDAWEAWAEVNPETAGRLGLSDGQQVRIESESGSFQARLRLYHGAQPGAVNVPYGLHSRVQGWGRSSGANPLAAVGDRRDPATRLPDWYSTRVRLVPA